MTICCICGQPITKYTRTTPVYAGCNQEAHATCWNALTDTEQATYAEWNTKYVQEVNAKIAAKVKELKP